MPTASTQSPAPAASTPARFPWQQAVTLLLATLALSLLGAIPAIRAGSGLLTEPLLSDALGNAGEIMTAVLAIAITVVAIVVELAATRYSHRVTSLFLRARTNVWVLSLFAVTALVCIWTASGLGGDHRLPKLLALALMSLSLLLLLPYFAYVLQFISPVAIIERLSRNGLDAVADSDRSPDEAQQMLRQAVEDLHDVARKAIEQSDRSVALAATEALFSLLYDYRNHRPALDAQWFTLNRALREDPDFVSMESDALQPIEHHGLWLELKVFRQLTALFAQGSLRMRDVAQVIAIRTRSQASADPDPGLRTLCLQSFNSYLRTSINHKDARISYYLLNQYRMLADALAAAGDGTIAIEIAAHFRYYGQLAVAQNLPFLLEVAAYDLVHLIEQCRAREAERGGAAGDSIADAVLDVLLDLDQTISSDEEQPSLVGVRRAQLQLAAVLLQDGDQVRVTRIARDLMSEPDARLEAIARALFEESRRNYWELTERGINFSYLEANLHSDVKKVLSQIRTLREAAADATGS